MGHTNLPVHSANPVIYLELDDVIEDPALQRFAGCVRALHPSISRCGKHYGHGVTMAALVSLVSNAAIEHDVAALVAEALRQNAEMLDAHTSEAGPLLLE